MKIKTMSLKDLDDLIRFTERNPGVIHIQTYKMLNQEWKKSKTFSLVDLFVIELTDDPELNEVILTVQPDEWDKALQLGLEYFEIVENYEMCSKVHKLMKTIKTK
jgi:hypothetical protein